MQTFRLILVVILAFVAFAPIARPVVRALRALTFRELWAIARFGRRFQFGELIYDLVDPQELQGFARAVLQELEQNQFLLAQFLPNENIDELEWRVTQGQLRDQDAAQIRSWDTEAGIGSRQGISRLMGELPPISRKIRLGEEERLRRRALERGSNAGIIAAIYDDARNMARAVAARVEMLRGEVLANGTITINENGVNPDPIDFGRKSGHTVAPSTLWSNTGASAPITDELAWRTTYRDTNGIDPALALVSQDTVNYLVLNAQYRAFAAFNGVTPAFLNLGQINTIRGTYNLPPLVVNDEKVRVNGSQQRVIPANKLIYLPPAGEPLGRTFYGTTAEALELAGARQITSDQMPGIVAVISKEYDPVATWTKAAAIALPTLANPDLTLAATVF